MKKDNSKTPKAIFDVLDFIEFEGKKNKDLIEENEKILDSIIERKFKERGWERVGC